MLTRDNTHLWKRYIIAVAKFLPSSLSVITESYPEVYSAIMWPSNGEKQAWVGFAIIIKHIRAKPSALSQNQSQLLARMHA